MAKKECNNCGNIKVPETVPYMAHETAMARNSRAIKLLVFALIAAIVLMFASNAIWLYAWNSYDYVSTTEETVYQQDGQGTNIIGNSNEVDNGSKTNNSQENENS
jgi:hypothetical protein